MAPPKAKGQKMGLGEFLTDSSLGSWADEMEDVPIPCGGRSGGYGGERSFGSGGGFGSGGYSERGGYSVREELPLPTKPPYTVHLGNMSFDATEGDIQDFFTGCDVTSVRIVEDKVERKPKGFGYAEFATLDGLKKALELHGTQFQGRNIRVSVAEPQKDRPDARDFGDWSRKGPLADVPGQRRASDRTGGFDRDRVPDRSQFGSRGFENAGSDAGSERGGRRAGYEQGDGKVRDFGDWSRKGPVNATSPAPAESHTRPISNDGPRDRKNSPAWGEGRSQDGGSRPPRREFTERPLVERAPTAADTDSQWRSKMRPDVPAAPPVKSSPTPSNRELSVPSSPAAPSAAPTTRPKLNLQKRTTSSAEPAPAPSSAVSDSKSSPFGAARPIDTFAKEKEIEEKRQAALKMKKEADDKAREEKRAADEKAKEERRAAKEAAQAERSKEKPNGKSKEKENGAEAPPPGKNYEILRRSANENLATADDEADVDGENGLLQGDKAVKPQEIIRDTQPAKVDSDGKTNGTPPASSDPSADTLEEDGWSTVSKPVKKGRGGNQAARAIAS